MATWIWIVIAIAVVVVLVLIVLGAQRGQQKQLEQRRDEAQHLREQADTHNRQAEERERIAREHQQQATEARQAAAEVGPAPIGSTRMRRRPTGSREPSGRGFAARVEAYLEGAAQQLPGHVAGPPRDRLQLDPGDADDLAAPLAVAARVGVLLADGGDLALLPAAEERAEPPEHATSVAETQPGS